MSCIYGMIEVLFVRTPSELLKEQIVPELGSSPSRHGWEWKQKTSKNLLIFFGGVVCFQCGFKSFLGNVCCLYIVGFCLGFLGKTRGLLKMLMDFPTFCMSRAFSAWCQVQLPWSMRFWKVFFLQVAFYLRKSPVLRNHPFLVVWYICPFQGHHLDRQACLETSHRLGTHRVLVLAALSAADLRGPQCGGLCHTDQTGDVLGMLGGMFRVSGFGVLGFGFCHS